MYNGVDICFGEGGIDRIGEFVDALFEQILKESAYHIERQPEHKCHYTYKCGYGGIFACQHTVDPAAADMLTALVRFGDCLTADIHNKAVAHICDGCAAVKTSFGFELLDDMLYKLAFVFVERELLHYEVIAFDQLACGKTQGESCSFGVVFDRMGDAVLKGDTLYYQASFEGGMDLWVHYLREDKTELLMKGVGGGRMQADKKFNNLFLASRGGIKKLDLGKKSTKNVDFETVFNYRPYEERAYLFDHIWRQVKDKFYVENLHNVDWEGYRENYLRFLPYINNE